MGLFSRRGKQEAPDQEDLGELNWSGEPSIHPEVQEWREDRQLQLVEPKDIGTAAAKLPAGVYGFSYSPHFESPLFRKQNFQSFEVHKLHNGAIHVIGFVTAGTAAKIADPAAVVEIMLYPDPWDEADVAVSVPVTRFGSVRGPLREDGNALKVELDPLQ